MKKVHTKYIKSLLILLSILLTGNMAMAQSNTASLTEDDMTFVIISLVLVVILLVLFFSFYLLQVLSLMVREDGIRRAKDKGIELVEEPSAWSKFYASLTDSVSLENELSIQLDHDYDGIKELDNHLPPWWKYMFYATIVFAVVYLYLYHVSGTLPLQAQEYEIAMAKAASFRAANSEGMETIDESNIVFSDDPVVQVSGLKVYQRNCVACHKAAGEGSIGPNLTDDYWLHGGSIQEVYYTIKHGVPDKGMIAWGEVLSPTKMSDVTSYLQTLRGTNPENPKAPQGVLYVKQVAPPADSTVTE